MTTDEVDILRVEDSPKDIELTLHALRKENLCNSIHVVRDGEEALEFHTGWMTLFITSPIGR